MNSLKRQRYHRQQENFDKTFSEACVTRTYPEKDWPKNCDYTKTDSNHLK